MCLHTFMQLLRDHRYYTCKQSKFLQYVVLYLNEGRCYNILLHAYPETLKRARKVGIENVLTMKTVNIDFVIKNDKFDLSKGKHMIQYSMLNRDFNIYRDFN
jgi:hypothetical protein